MGIMGVSMSMNGYSYVHGNPINLTDPSGEHPAVAAALYGALAGFIAGGIIGGAIEAGIQLSDGTPLHCLDQRAIGKAIAQGAILGAIGGAVAAAAPLLGAGAGGTVALALGVDFAAGMAVDMLWNDMSFREAAISNAAGMFVGGAIGVAAGAAGRAIAKSPAGQAISDRIGRALGRGEDGATTMRMRRAWYSDDDTPNPRRNLQDHETGRGHTVERHVGRSETWLRNRLREDSNLTNASSFRNEQVANRTQAQLKNRNQELIDQWLESGDTRPLVVETTMDDPVGVVVTRGPRNTFPVSQTKKAQGIIVRDDSEQGWQFLTSYPTN